MEVWNIAVDDNEGDTSQEEFDEDEEEATLSSIIKHVEGVTKDQAYIAKEFKGWGRQPVPKGTLLYSSSGLQEQPDSFQFFMIDSLSTVTSVKHPGIPLNSAVTDNPLHNVIRLFGVAKIDCDACMDTKVINDQRDSSVSICINVHGFLSYFYVLPTGKLGEDVKYWQSSKADGFLDFLNEKLKKQILDDSSCVPYHNFVLNNKCIILLEALKASDVGRNIYQFQNSNSKESSKKIVLKLHCSLPRFAWKAQKVLDDNSTLYDGCKFQCFETNINNNIRFLTDRNLGGCTWLELKANSYFQRDDSPNDPPGCPTKETYCQIELDVHFENLVKLPENNIRCSPSVRILSFDIEVMVSPDDIILHQNRHRPVIQIGNVIGNYQPSTNTKSVIGKSVFAVGTCDPIPDAKVVEFLISENHKASDEENIKDAESNMLGAWRDFVLLMDPDIIIGYNIKKYDIPYLIDRAHILENKNSTRLPYLGRMKKVKTGIRTIENCVKKVHHYDINNIDIQGRVILDLYPILMRHDRQGSGPGYFKLCNVANRLLAPKEKKQDVDYKEIEKLQKGDSTTRQKLAEYCLQDSMIPFLVLHTLVPARNEKIEIIKLYLESSQSGGNLLRHLVNKSIHYKEYFRQLQMVVLIPHSQEDDKSRLNETRINMDSFLN